MNTILSIGDFTGSPGRIVTVPISINDATGLQSVTLTLNYDDDILSIPDPNLETASNEGVSRTDITADWQLDNREEADSDSELSNPVANDRDGEVSISLINPDNSPVSGEGNILEIDFQVNLDATVDSMTTINLQSARLGIDGEEIVLAENNLVDGSFTVEEIPTNDISRFSRIPIERFFEFEKGFHLYTIDQNEIRIVQERSAAGELAYNYEGEKFVVLDSDKDALTGATLDTVSPVYRFFNTDTGAHLFTMDENEKNHILNNLPNYNFENVGYYAFESPIEGLETIPVFRMLNNQSGAHLFTTDENEINFIQANLPHFSLEGNGGVAFHVFHLDDAPA